MSDDRPLRVIVVDDEPVARKTIRLLAQRDKDVVVIAECRNGAEAIDAVNEHKPDLLFLDIQMPGLDGFDVLELLGDPAPAIVFVTAYDQYAIRAFEVHALDYLLKPFTDERFMRALNRAKELISAGDTPSLSKLTASHRLAMKRFMVRSAGRVIFLKAGEIDWIEAADYYARLRVGSKSYLIRESMNDLEASLDPAAFVRVHRSAIVNLDRLRDMPALTATKQEIVLTDGTHLPMSRSRRKNLESRVKGKM
jgi:two-component system LytT family response regulator